MLTLCGNQSAVPIQNYQHGRRLCPATTLEMDVAKDNTGQTSAQLRQRATTHESEAMSEDTHDYIWAFRTDLTVHMMHKQGSSLEDIIVRLVEEKNAFRKDLMAKDAEAWPLLVYTPKDRPSQVTTEFMEEMTSAIRMSQYRVPLSSFVDAPEGVMMGPDACQVCGKPIAQGLCAHLSGMEDAVGLPSGYPRGSGVTEPAGLGLLWPDRRPKD